MDDLKETKICECECHGGRGILHCAPCCELTYEEYLNDDGTINIETWSKLFQNTFDAIPTFTVGFDGKYYRIHK